MKLRQSHYEARPEEMPNGPEATGYSGSRLPPESPPGPPTVEETADHFLQAQKAESGQPSAKVEVASGGSKP